MDDVVIPRMVSGFLLGVLSAAPQEISAQGLSPSYSWSLFWCSHVVILLINQSAHPDIGMLKHNALNYFLHAWWEGIPQRNCLHRAGPERGATLCLANGKMPRYSQMHGVWDSVMSLSIHLPAQIYGSFRIAAGACSWKQARWAI